MLKIGGTTVVNNWSSSITTLTHMVGSIALQANIRYDIQLDYFSQSGSAVSETHLNWYSDSQASQVIPTGRLYPTVNGATAAPPTITSAPQAFAYLNQPFSFTITTSSNTPATVSIPAGTLPPGLSFLPALPAIGGTATKAGDYPLVITATNSAGSASAVLDLQVLDSGNLITKEVWTGLPSSGSPSVADIPLTTTPNITGTLNSFEDTAANYGDNYGERIRGYITVPTTGMYFFWVAANDVAEFWLDRFGAGK